MAALNNHAVLDTYRRGCCHLHDDGEALYCMAKAVFCTVSNCIRIDEFRARWERENNHKERLLNEK